MPRNLTPDFVDNTEATATRPLFVVKINHSGTEEYLSCIGAVTFDGDSYVAGGAEISGLSDSMATIRLPATSTRIGEVQDSDWRGGICVVYALYYDSMTDVVFAASDGVPIIDGLIDSSGFSGDFVTIVAKHKNLLGKNTPVLTFDDACNHMPVPGEVLTWEGVDIVIAGTVRWFDVQLKYNNVFGGIFERVNSGGGL